MARPSGRGMGCVLWSFDWYSASVPAIIHAIYYYIGPRYNGTRLYVSLKCDLKIFIRFSICWICISPKINDTKMYFSSNTLYVILFKLHTHWESTKNEMFKPGMKTALFVLWQNCDLTNSHDDVIKWKHFPRYWPFVRGIHRSPVTSQHKG